MSGETRIVSAVASLSAQGTIGSSRQQAIETAVAAAVQRLIDEGVSMDEVDRYREAQLTARDLVNAHYDAADANPTPQPQPESRE
ncbi:MAG TPA: hypothetical protein VFO16_24155 [Pseudonocardiaceae bacterium]|nr:hypothetical protein [Pseudonocardiaceae bacterium]